jgi:hypothetical protein
MLRLYLDLVESSVHPRGMSDPNRLLFPDGPSMCRIGDFTDQWERHLTLGIGARKR